MSDDGESLVRERHGRVLLLRLNRPEARNALTTELIRALGTAFNEADADPDVRAIVLTGTGDRAFCAGMDLRSFSSGEGVGLGTDEAADGFNRFIGGGVRLPVVGAANATAVAGGLELLLGCDLVVASEDAQFGLPEAKRGLFAAGGGTALGTRIPLAVALELLLTGDSIDAARAYELGLVNRVVPADAVVSTALALAERIAENGPLGLAASKELARLALTDRAQAAARMDEWRSTVFSSDDAREGALAFVEKRPPVWQGR